jgi:hypothetical protein
LLAAVRGIHAGILLLYKEALRRLSPTNSDEALIRTKILPKRDAQGNIYFVGDGKKTVDVHQIRERFASLDIVTDWTRFDRITNVRSEVEHYYTKTSKKALQGLIADVFVVTRHFITTQLQEDPLTLLGDETWQTMLDVADVHEAARAECVAALKAFPWESAAVEQGVLEITCGTCSSDLLRPTGTAFNDGMTLECRACGETTTAEQSCRKQSRLRSREPCTYPTRTATKSHTRIVQNAPTRTSWRTNAAPYVANPLNTPARAAARQFPLRR